MTNPASHDDQYTHIFLFNTPSDWLHTPDRPALLAALNLPPDWPGAITPVAAASLAELDLDNLNQALDEKTQRAVFVNAENAFGRYWLPRLQAGLPADARFRLCSALTTRVYELSPLPEGFRYDGSYQQLDNALYLQQKPARPVPVARLNPDAVVVRVTNGTLAVADFAESRLANKLVATNVFLQPVRATALRSENVPVVGDQHPLPAHPLRDFHHWLMHTDAQALPEGFPGLDERPVLLHVTMDWGGGVNKWIDDYARAEPGFHHLTLVSEGEFFRQRFGERLSLRWGGASGPVLQRFDLSDPIAVMAVQHAEYERILHSVLDAFGVQRVAVSSLIGHGLASLYTGLPTLRIFHDFFPHWPVLNARLNGKKPGAAAWQEAFAESTHEAFGGIDAETHAQWHKALLAGYGQKNVALVAPSESAVANLQALGVPGSRKALHVIPHAIRPFELPFQLSADTDSRPLTILVPGRINAVKGQAVLEKLLPALRQRLPDARVVLLGAGKDGRHLAAEPGVEIIEDYQAEELPQHLAAIRPHVALLLSQAAETFSYALSEMHQAGIPVIATAIGALAERIEPEKTGWLVTGETDQEQAQQVLQQLQTLAANRQKLSVVEKRLKTLTLPRPEETLVAYARLWKKLTASSKTNSVEPRPSAETLWPRYGHRQLADLSLRLRAQIRQLQQRLAASEELTKERTRWAHDLQKHILELDHAISSLKAEQDRLHETIAEREKHIAAERAEAEHLRQVLKAEQDRLHGEIQALQGELTAVYNSTSWRITKPLRFARRSLQNGLPRAAYRLKQARGLPLRFSCSVKTRGLKGTLGLIRNRLGAAPEALNPAVRETVALEKHFTPIALPLAESPLVSIIIPVYNHFEHTWNCLKSIAELDTDLPFEVIVVDDASTDETAEKMALIAGVRYHRQAENGGFIEACNTGAALATGEYLLFLNNDTVVRPGWLDALMRTFSDHPDCGLAGSQLLYPDGRLQEAGGIVFSDASGWNYGRLENPQAPEFNHLREVDYCSGASIAIKKALFEQLGGFDSRYKPAYYEDTDLAFAVREAGYRVLYQPASQVVHFEGVSSGTDLASGTKRFQAINQKKFAEKWAHALTRQPDPATDIELARIHGQPPRVLIADATTPTPDQDSGSVRMLNLIRILRDLGYHVVFMPENLSHAGAYTEALQQMGVECLYHPSVKNPMDYLRDKGKYLDAVILSRYYVAEPLLPLVRHFAPQARVIFDTVDLHYVREQRQAELEDNEKLARLAEKTRLREQACMQQADVTWVVSPYEKQVLEKEVPAARIQVLSNIHEVFGCRKGFDERRDLLFVGGFQHTPNVDAVQWFVTDIWPLIHQQLPEAKFHLVGSKAPEEIRALGEVDGVRFHGFVPNIEPFLDGCRVAVAPLRFGAGVKGKVNLSMSYGQPVVATGVATEGMQTEHGVDVLNADTPEAFAEAVVSVYQDKALWQKLSEGGLKNVERWFSFATAREAVKRALNP